MGRHDPAAHPSPPGPRKVDHVPHGTCDTPVVNPSTYRSVTMCRGMVKSEMSDYVGSRPAGHAERIDSREEAGRAAPSLAVRRRLPRRRPTTDLLAEQQASIASARTAFSGRRERSHRAAATCSAPSRNALPRASHQSLGAPQSAPALPGPPLASRAPPLGSSRSTPGVSHITLVSERLHRRPPRTTKDPAVPGRVSHLRWS